MNIPGYDQMDETERGAISGNVSPDRAHSASSVPDAAARGARQEPPGSPRLAERASAPPALIASLRAPVEPTAGPGPLHIPPWAVPGGKRDTVAGALQKLGIYALSQRCGELRRYGWPIRRQMVRRGWKWVAEYWIER